MKKLGPKPEKKLNILMVSSEMYPFAKIGGLADVVDSLSGALKNLGHDVRVVLPRYSLIDTSHYSVQPVLEPMGVWMGNKEEWCSVQQTHSSHGVPVYFIEHTSFDRWGLTTTHQYMTTITTRFFDFLSSALQLLKTLVLNRYRTCKRL